MKEDITIKQISCSFCGNLQSDVELLIEGDNAHICNLCIDKSKSIIQDNLDQSLQRLKNNKKMNNSFGKDVINSYLKLRNSEIKEFNQKENFNKNKPITKWERINTLDC